MSTNIIGITQFGFSSVCSFSQDAKVVFLFEVSGVKDICADLKPCIDINRYSSSVNKWYIEMYLYRGQRIFYFTNKLQKKRMFGQVKQEDLVWNTKGVFLGGGGFCCFFFVPLFSTTGKQPFWHALWASINFSRKVVQFISSNYFQGLQMTPLFVIGTFHQVHGRSAYAKTVSLQKCQDHNLNV